MQAMDPAEHADLVNEIRCAMLGASSWGQDAGQQAGLASPSWLDCLAACRLMAAASCPSLLTQGLNASPYRRHSQAFTLNASLLLSG